MGELKKEVEELRSSHAALKCSFEYLGEHLGSEVKKAQVGNLCVAFISHSVKLFPCMKHAPVLLNVFATIYTSLGVCTYVPTDLPTTCRRSCQ